MEKRPFNTSFMKSLTTRCVFMNQDTPVTKQQQRVEAKLFSLLVKRPYLR